MMQPSANGIASLFQGNPAALQQRVQKEQQAKPGLPPDLTELMALQILTEENDAAQRQAAMNQLQQAGGANMPTVAQTLQERAKQALQARMMQAQQQAQQPPQPQPIPTAPPADQPEASPEMLQQLAALQAQGKGGLDQLPSNVGNYAGGGIIAFNGEERSDVPDEKLTPEEAKDILERIKDRTAPKEEVSDAPAIKKALAFAAGLPAAAADIATLPLNILRRYVRNPMDESPRASLTPVSDIRSEYLGMGKEPAPQATPQDAPRSEPTRAPEPQGIEAIIAQRADDLERQAGRKMSPEARALFTQREMNKFLSQEKIVPPSTTKAPPSASPVAPPNAGPSAPPAAPPRAGAPRQEPPAATQPQVPAGILTPAQETQVNQIMLDRMGADPEARRLAKLKRLDEMIGAPDTASLQTLADELAAKRQRIAKEQEANKGFDEYMRQIALAPRGLTSAAAGSYGAEAQRNRAKALETQDFETLKSMLDTQAKISDVKRGWNEKKFTISEQEFDSVYKEKYDAAKELGKSNAEAKKLAQEAVLERERQANALLTARIYTGPQMAANARIERAIASYKKANPKATDYEAQMAVTQPNAYLAPDKQTLAELKVLAENLRAMTDPLKNPNVESQQEAARQLALVTAKMAQMGGVDLGGASVPPPGAVRLKQ